MDIKRLLDKIKRRSWKAESRSISINHEVLKFSKVFKNNLVTLLISAFGMVAALSWNDAIKNAIDVLIPGKTFVYKFYAAITITLFSLIVIYFISKLKSSE